MGRRIFPVLVIALLLLFIAGRTLAGFVIEYEWWKELGQLETWASILLYGLLPVVVAALVVFAVLWIAHARGLKHAGTGLRRHPAYARIATVALLVVGIVVAAAAIDGWTVVRFAGSHRAGAGTNPWRDPVYGQPLSFYIFDLPFYRELAQLVLVTAVLAGLLNWLTGRIWTLRDRFPGLHGNIAIDLELGDLLREGLTYPFARVALALFLIALAGSLWLGRYTLVYSDHGFMVGMDWIDEHVRVPLQWVAIATALAGAVLALAGRLRWLLVLVVVLVLRGIIPGIIATLYVRPNELGLQKPYIEHHIRSTRAAWGFDERLKEMQFPAKLESTVNVSANQPLFDNVRLWDWRAFHDTITQVQALRQYYVFPDTDVDRYTIDGQMRQVMVAARELDVNQLGGQRTSWINTHLIYTHSYGLVMAAASRITPEGSPVFYIQDAPPRLNTGSLKLTRPEIYFGENLHEPVFVRTNQEEFSYPAGAENVHTRYEGRGGIPIASPLIRLAAAVTRGDWNILLTGYLRGDSRMLIRRDVAARVKALAGFLEWDPDPYIVITQDGRLVWIIDGYTTTDAHPYSRRLSIRQIGEANYIRNAVKAVVDAYDGSVTLYVFDSADPVIRAWQAILPRLFRPASEMAADLRAHVRHPELQFLAQAEIYRTFHMRDPEAFYNKEDLWDVAREKYSQNADADRVQPTFVVATLPGETKPEFLLIMSFTPRGKDNMIGLMAARSDGEHLGELVVLQLSKQALIYGPLQIEARIDSDQNISKDLTLWNQQGSQVLRGQMLVLPVGDTFVYVEPIYLQASQARMPQLKRVALAMGNRLIYGETYEQALGLLAGQQVRTETAPPPEATASTTAPTTAPPPAGDRKLEAAREQIRRLRKQLDELESLLK
ncbi:MAG TPA: UPF0182 family protein [Bryobacteraceae bacterium]|nr:UPF0182 family protein [Bryobacteraceae bacterium]